VAGAALLALNVAALVIAALLPGPSGPRGSSYATSSGGTAAWAELLESYGYRVERLRKRPDRTRLDPAATVVVTQPDGMTRGEAEALAEFVDAGGRLVAARTGPGWADRLLPAAPAWEAEAPEHWRVPAAALRRPRRPAAGSPASGLARAGVQAVRSAGEGRWAPSRAGEPLVVPADPGEEGSLVISARRGRGQVVLVADPSPLENRLIDKADNAALAIALAGDRRRPVRFAEAFHGYGEARGLGALPARWRAALAGVALALIVGMLAAARRVGAPDEEPPAPVPPRREYLTAMALTLERTGDLDEARERLSSLERHGHRVTPR
jgi:hypothetical protein